MTQPVRRTRSKAIADANSHPQATTSKRSRKAESTPDSSRTFPSPADATTRARSPVASTLISNSANRRGLRAAWRADIEADFAGPLRRARNPTSPATTAASSMATGSSPRRSQRSRNMLSQLFDEIVDEKSFESVGEADADSTPNLEYESESEASSLLSDNEPVLAFKYRSGSHKTAPELPGTKGRFSEQWRKAANGEHGSGGPAALKVGANRNPMRKTSKSFLDLPRELRDQIYRELYLQPTAIRISQPKFHVAVKVTTGVPMAFSRTNKQIHEEIMKVYIGENHFILDLNILTGIDFLAAMPQTIARHFSSITLGKSIMSGYVRYELGMFDSSRLRTDLVKKLIYEWNLHTISIQVPDDHGANAHGTQGNGNPNAPNGNPNGPNNPWFNLASLHPRHDYSWSLMRELIDTMLEFGFDNLRFVYNLPFTEAMHDPTKLLRLYAVQRVLYLDDEFEIETQVKRIDMARLAGRRDEFSSKQAVEKYVRQRRKTRLFRVGYGKKKVWETGGVVEFRQAKDAAEMVAGGDGLWDVRELLRMVSNVGLGEGMDEY